MIVIQAARCRYLAVDPVAIQHNAVTIQACFCRYRTRIQAHAPNTRDGYAGVAAAYEVEDVGAAKVVGAGGAAGAYLWYVSDEDSSDDLSDDLSDDEGTGKSLSKQAELSHISSHLFSVALPHLCSIHLFVSTT